MEGGVAYGVLGVERVVGDGVRTEVVYQGAERQPVRPARRKVLDAHIAILRRVVL